MTPSSPPQYGVATVLSIVILAILLPVIVWQQRYSARHAVATVTNSSPFAIPALTASSRCPAGLVDNANEILGLPIPAGTAHFSITATAGVYVPS